MSISVKNEALRRCGAEYKKLSQKLSQIENSLQTIRKSLDSDIKHERNIDKDFKEVCEDVDLNERSLTDIAKFLSDTVKAYEGAEKNIEKDLNKLSQKKSDSNVFSNIFGKLGSIRKKAEAILKILLGFGIFGAPIGTIITLNEIKKYYAEKGITVNNKEEKPIEIKKADIPELNGILSYDPSKYKEEVLLLQKRLNELKITDDLGRALEEDGKFGKNTLAAVNKYKEEYGLWNYGEYEGKVGQTTWVHLFTNTNQLSIPEEKVKISESKESKEQTSNSFEQTSNSILNENVLINLINQYTKFVYTDSSGKRSKELQIYYEWGGKMSLEKLNKKMIELGLKADDPILQEKINSMAKNKKIMLGIDCSGFVLEVVNKATNGKATEYYRNNIPDLISNKVKDVISYGVSAENMTSLSYSDKVTQLKDVRPGDYIRFAGGSHIGVVYKVQGDNIYYAHSSGSKGPHLGTIKVSEAGKDGLNLKKYATFDDWNSDYSKDIQSLFDYICRPKFLIESDKTVVVPEQPATPKSDISNKEEEAIKRFLTLTIKHEGAGIFSNVSNPGDDMALSYGFYQWNIGSGTFQRLFREFDNKCPGKLEQIIGDGKANQLRKYILYKTDENGNFIKDKSGNMIPLDVASGLKWAKSNISDGNYSVKSDWKEVLIELGRYEGMQKVQVNDAINNYIKPAINQLNEFGLELTDRNLYIMNDMLVQGGGFYYRDEKNIEGKMVKIDKNYYTSKLNNNMTQKEKLVTIIAARATTCSTQWERNFAVRKIPYVMGYGYTTHGEDKNLKGTNRFVLNPEEILNKDLGAKNGYKNWRDDLDKQYGFTDKVLDKDILINTMTIDNVRDIINGL